MIKVFDMETGEILECSAMPTASSRTASEEVRGYGLPRLALQEVESIRPELAMPPDLATTDVAEILVRFR